MYGVLSIPYNRWSEYSVEPGHYYAKQRRGIVCHHPYPHAVVAGAGLSVEIRELRVIDTYHRSKWSGIGYHFVIADSGRIFVARGPDRTGAHSPGQNSSTYGIAFLINGSLNRPSSAAMESTDYLIAYLIQEGRLRPTYDVSMHSDRQQTSCPGRTAEEFLENYKWTHLSITPPVVHERRILREGMNGEDVRQVQRALDMPERYQTGFFGPITESYVLEFQRNSDLTLDGVVGPNTYGILYGD